MRTSSTRSSRSPPMTRMNVSGIRFFFPALIRILNQFERQRRCPRYFDFGKKETEKMELFHCIIFQPQGSGTKSPEEISAVPLP